MNNNTIIVVHTIWLIFLLICLVILREDARDVEVNLKYLNLMSEAHSIIINQHAEWFEEIMNLHETSYQTNACKRISFLDEGQGG